MRQACPPKAHGVFIIKEIPKPYGEGVRISVIKEGHLPNPYTEDVVPGKTPPKGRALDSGGGTWRQMLNVTVRPPGI